jgi:H+/gluconate symporter-like permease
MLTALINIPLGMRIKKAGTGFYVAYGVWIAILAVMFTVLVWMKPENKQIADGKDITTIMDETESDAEEVIDTKE